MHNNVSIRVAPDWGRSQSEVLYPSIKTCPSCRFRRGAAVWNQAEVLRFLGRVYSVDTSKQDQSFGAYIIPAIISFAAACGCGIVAAAVYTWQKRAKSPGMPPHTQLQEYSSPDKG